MILCWMGQGGDVVQAWSSCSKLLCWFVRPWLKLKSSAISNQRCIYIFYIWTADRAEDKYHTAAFSERAVFELSSAQSDGGEPQGPVSGPLRILTWSERPPLMEKPGWAAELRWFIFWCIYIKNKGFLLYLKLFFSFLISKSLSFTLI